MDIRKASMDIEVKPETRLCKVGDEYGYFHIWEQYSVPIPESPLIGGAPAGVVAQVFGIVEFADGVKRVQPYEIIFCDEQSITLVQLNAVRGGTRKGKRNGKEK